METHRGGMINKKYKQTNKLAIYFTDTLFRFLDDEKKDTGHTKSSIVRTALTEYMMKRIKEKIKNRKEIKKYMVEIYTRYSSVK